MSQSTRKLLLSALGMVLAFSINAAEEKEDIKPETAGTKPSMTFKKGDYEFTMGGKTKIETYWQRNVYLLNHALPDENEFIKHTLDLNFNFAFGQERYGYKAVEAQTSIRHKSVWGKPLGYADRESGPTGPSSVKLSNTIFGSHAHTSGKPLLWIKDAWLQFGLNAAFGTSANHLHFLKMGWFPFELGRGIALGGAYGLNKEILGLYSYPEDKSSPGVLLSGVIIQDKLTYDLYYSKFEERSKGLSDTINLDKRHILSQRNTPWRGINKDDDVVAGRLKWKALKNDKGMLEFEPYVFYNAASDQKVEIAPDARAKWGSYGCAIEQTYKNFEWGGDVAANYGHEELFAIDRNNFKIKNDGTGKLVEQYTHVVDKATGKTPVLVTDDAQKFTVFSINNVGVSKNGAVIVNDNGTETDFKNTDKRFRPCYKNEFRGWMTTLDAAYKFPELHLKVSGAYGYASGDINPHITEKDKKYKGFVGLHEYYIGKRVPSILILDGRYTVRPTSISPNVIEANTDSAFSDLQHVGLGATWTPKTRIRNLSFNPNMIFFWKADATNKTNPLKQDSVLCEEASKYMGLELNLLSKCTILPDLTLFANFAAFIPGTLYDDIYGISLEKDIFKDIVDDPRNDIEDVNLNALGLTVGKDTAYYFNAGFEYKF